jgi:hypothetical protein
MGRESRMNRESRNLPPGTFILDCYGRPITAGCEIVLLQPHVGRVYVQSIETAVQMDPTQKPLPPGMVKITGMAHFSYLAPKGVPQREFMLARSVEELVMAGVIREVAPEDATGGELKVPTGEWMGEGEGEGGETPIAPPTTGPKLVLTD